MMTTPLLEDYDDGGNAASGVGRGVVTILSPLQDETKFGKGGALSDLGTNASHDGRDDEQLHPLGTALGLLVTAKHKNGCGSEVEVNATRVKRIAGKVPVFIKSCLRVALSLMEC